MLRSELLTFLSFTPCPYVKLQLMFYLRLGDTMSGELHDGIVASSDRPLDVIEPDLDRPAALPTVIGHRDSSDPAPVKPLRRQTTAPARRQTIAAAFVSKSRRNPPICSVAGRLATAVQNISTFPGRDYGIQSTLAT